MWPAGRSLPTPGLEVLITDLYSLSLSIQDGNPVVNIDTKKNKSVLTTGFQSCIVKIREFKAIIGSHIPIVHTYII